jgi:hypothetical protein
MKIVRTPDFRLTPFQQVVLRLAYFSLKLCKFNSNLTRSHQAEILVKIESLIIKGH